MKKNWFFIILLTISSLSLAGTAAYFSIFGLAKLFYGAGVGVVILASVLELSKLVTVSYVYRYWKHIAKALRLYYVFGVIFIMLLTSIGIYGFLTSAYQSTANKIETRDSQIKILENKKVLFIGQVDRMNKSIENSNKRINTISDIRDQQEQRLNSLYGKNSVTSAKRTENQITSSDEQIKNLNLDITQKIQQLNSINDSIAYYDQQIIIAKSSDVSNEIGPLKYLSDLTGMSMNGVVNILVLLIIFVFDPMAITLLIGVNQLTTMYKKRDNNEDENELPLLNIEKNINNHDNINDINNSEKSINENSVVNNDKNVIVDTNVDYNDISVNYNIQKTEPVEKISDDKNINTDYNNIFVNYNIQKTNPVEKSPIDKNIYMDYQNKFEANNTSFSSKEDENEQINFDENINHAIETDDEDISDYDNNDYFSSKDMEENNFIKNELNGDTNENLNYKTELIDLNLENIQNDLDVYHNTFGFGKIIKYNLNKKSATIQFENDIKEISTEYANLKEVKKVLVDDNIESVQYLDFFEDDPEIQDLIVKKNNPIIENVISNEIDNNIEENIINDIISDQNENDPNYIENDIIQNILTETPLVLINNDINSNDNNNINDISTETPLVLINNDINSNDNISTETPLELINNNDINSNDNNNINDISTETPLVLINNDINSNDNISTETPLELINNNDIILNHELNTNNINEIEEKSFNNNINENSEMKKGKREQQSMVWKGKKII